MRYTHNSIPPKLSLPAANIFEARAPGLPSTQHSTCADTPRLGFSVGSGTHPPKFWPSNAGGGGGECRTKCKIYLDSRENMYIIPRVCVCPEKREEEGKHENHINPSIYPTTLDLNARASAQRLCTSPVPPLPFPHLTRSTHPPTQHPPSHHPHSTAPH